MASQETTAHDTEQAINVQPNAPWLQDNGEDTPEECLKTITPLWDQLTWEKYLEWFETKRPESIVHPKKYDMICEELEESIFVYAQSNADDETKCRVNKMLDELTPVQRKTIELLFWHSMSNAEVAKVLGQSRSAIRETKKRALNRLKRILRAPLPSSRIMKGKDDFAPELTGVKDGTTELATGKVPKAS